MGSHFSHLPVEVLFYGSPATRQKLEDLGFQGKWRLNEDKTLFTTENGNFIFDIQLEQPVTDPEKEHLKIIQVPGVVDTGFFFNLAGRIIIGHLDGSFEIRN